MAASAQIAVEPLLVDFVHMQQAVGAPVAVCGILDVLAEHAGALFVAAAKQIAAIVMVTNVVIAVMLVVVIHPSVSS